MSPIAVFVRTLLKSSAMFMGVTTIFLHPQLEWRATTQQQSTVGARQSPREARVDALIEALKDPDAGVRRTVVRALASMHSARAVPALISAMKDADADTRALLIGALGELGDDRAIDTLMQALKDEDASVRRSAAAAIAELSGGGGHRRPRPNPNPQPNPRPDPSPVVR